MTGTPTTTDLEIYRNKCEALAKEMFGDAITSIAITAWDVDGKLIEFDRGKYELSQYNDIPHFYNCKTTEEKEARLMLLLQNVRIAIEKFDHEIEIKNINFVKDKK